LRERKEDIPLLARHFLVWYATKHGQSKLRLTEEDEATLEAYDWPGNVRELENVMEHRASVHRGRTGVPVASRWNEYAG
jgi:DNA-binding NtrC family response regulator